MTETISRLFTPPDRDAPPTVVDRNSPEVEDAKRKRARALAQGAGFGRTRLTQIGETAPVATGKTSLVGAIGTG